LADKKPASLRFWTRLTIRAGIAFWVAVFALGVVPEIVTMIGLINHLVFGLWLLWLLLVALSLQKQTKTDQGEVVS
jgi:hypothetical protein